MSKKLTIKKPISVHHVGDKEVKGVKAAINKILFYFFYFYLYIYPPIYLYLNCTKFFSKELQK